MTAGQIKAPTCIPLRSTPGSKQNIDDDTPIELSCDTPNTTIFYTINGEKPVPFDTKSRWTYTYTGPFLLSAGKRTIKSVASYPDGRNSNTVTKVYYIKESNPVEELERLSLDSQLDNSFSQEEDTFKRRVLAESFRSNVQALPPGGLYTANRAKQRSGTSPGRGEPVSPTGPVPRASPTGPRASTPSRSAPGTPNRKRRSMKIATDVMKQVRIEEDSLQTNMTFTKETEKCPQCFTDKPPNPLAKYCHQCSFYLPPNPVEPGTVKCLHCHSTVPGDMSHCLVCEARITSQQLNLPTTEAIVCSGCKFKNPPGSKTCVVCEERLELTIKPPQPAPPPAFHHDHNKRQCKKCSRDNALEARYCDWCGGSMVDLSQPLVCCSCAFQNPPLALYCGNCSFSLLPKPTVSTPTKVCWSDEIPHPPPPDPVIRSRDPVLISIDTQTEGIFYKSAKRLQAEENSTTDNMRQVYRSRGLSITKYSPGGGNWRQNVDHITNHIKVYSQLNSEYQDIIGKHAFGKVTMATLFKDMSELHISYVFSTKKASKKTESMGKKSVSLNSVASSPQNKAPRAASIASTTPSDLSELLAEELKKPGAENGVVITKTHALLQEGSDNGSKKSDDLKASSKTSLISNGDDGGSGGGDDKPIPRATKDDSSASMSRQTSHRKSLKKKVAPKDMHELRIGKLNSTLLSEIIKDGDEQRVNRLLGQGADCNTTTSGGVPVLCLAAKNKHFGAFKALTAHGSDLHSTVPSTQDTALHIAVQQGSQDIVKFLVKQGADFQRPNGANKSPLDVARERHNQRAVQLFTSTMGSSLLGMK
ncbi:double zinc ribbon and ankyrin repeat-containing protein 1-like isoform X2 [Bolinopsis microptera]|uniref:double zinc ribbon and ankyrin repeat-containing protein 1-like isoform X2 n=1 Tax=Bolinopsis microptera TaxID=2820187 RepID=UPI0030796D5A